MTMDATDNISFKECIRVLFNILKKMRREGLLSMEQHIESPHESPLLQSIAGSPEGSFLCEIFEKYVILGFPDDKPEDVYFPIFLTNERCVFMYMALMVASRWGEQPRECLNMACQSTWETPLITMAEINSWITEWETVDMGTRKRGVYRDPVGHA